MDYGGSDHRRTQKQINEMNWHSMIQNTDYAVALWGLSYLALIISAGTCMYYSINSLRLVKSKCGYVTLGVSSCGLAVSLVCCVL